MVPVDDTVLRQLCRREQLFVWKQSSRETMLQVVARNRGAQRARPAQVTLQEVFGRPLQIDHHMQRDERCKPQPLVSCEAQALTVA